MLVAMLFHARCDGLDNSGGHDLRLRKIRRVADVVNIAIATV
jgi:hypothetical protein